MDSFQAATFDRQITRLRRPGADDRGIVFVQEDLGFNILSHVRVADESDSLLLHELDPAHHDRVLVELHVGDAVHEQTAGTICAFEDGDSMAGAIQLRSSRKSGGPRPDNCDFLPSANFGLLRNYPTFFPASIDNRGFDVLDRDGWSVDSEDARSFARSGANAAGELREVIRLVETIERFLPQATVNEIVPLGDQVIDWAADRK